MVGRAAKRRKRGRSVVADSVTPRTVARLAPQSMGFSRQEYWSGLPVPPPGDRPNSGMEPGSPALQTDLLTSEPPGAPAAKRAVPNTGQRVSRTACDSLGGGRGSREGGWGGGVGDLQTPHQDGCSSNGLCSWRPKVIAGAGLNEQVVRPGGSECRRWAGRAWQLSRQTGRHGGGW